MEKLIWTESGTTFHSQDPPDASGTTIYIISPYSVLISVVKTQKTTCSVLEEPRVAILGSEKPLRVRSHTLSIFDT